MIGVQDSNLVEVVRLTPVACLSGLFVPTTPPPIFDCAAVSAFHGRFHTVTNGAALFQLLLVVAMCSSLPAVHRGGPSLSEREEIVKVLLLCSSDQI